MHTKGVIIGQWKVFSQLRNLKGVLYKTIEHSHVKRPTKLTKHGSSKRNLSVGIVENVQLIRDHIPQLLSNLTSKTTNWPFIWPSLKISFGVSRAKGTVVSNKPFKMVKSSEPHTNTAGKSVQSTIGSEPEHSNLSFPLRTRQLLSAFSQVDSPVSKVEILKELNELLRIEPLAKHEAIKVGSIHLFHRARLCADREQNSALVAALNECLALLGYCSPVKAAGIRILSIDGGGVRGILVLEMLKKLEELTGKRVHELFDFICGVSTGSILACLLVIKELPIEAVLQNYKSLSATIFTQSALKGTKNLVLSHSYYDTKLWEQVLRQQVGEQTLISTRRNDKCPKLCAISTVVDNGIPNISPFVFRNYTFPSKVQSQYRGSHKYKIWEAVRASAAAPTYFEEFKLDNVLHQDGGVLCNNPTAIAIHESKLLWPDSEIQCIVSFGTGRTIPLVYENSSRADNGTVSTSSWKDKFLAILNSATDTEAVHFMLSDLLPPDIYFRFNPYVTELLNLDEINPDKIKKLKLDALMYLRRNEDKFQQAAKAISKPKSLTKRTLEWLSMLGLLAGKL